MRTLVWKLNGRWHTAALAIFMVGILGHMSEHIVQVLQIYALGMDVPDSRGIVGQWIPWLATSEAMHYSYAVYTLVGLVILLPGFRGRDHFWWNTALTFQFWHYVEHVILLYQAVTGDFLFGAAAPSSLLQVFIPRVELHFMYNALVFVPMVIGLYYHFTANSPDDGSKDCDCADVLPSARRAMELAR